MSEENMKVHDSVVLLRDLPEHRLKAGDIGTVVLVHDGGAGYEVEFSTLAGETMAHLLQLTRCVLRFSQ
jgi:hypothetical protein